MERLKSKDPAFSSNFLSLDLVREEPFGGIYIRRRKYHHQESRFYQLVKQGGYLSQEDEADYLRLLTGRGGTGRPGDSRLGLAAFMTDLWIPLGEGRKSTGFC